MEFLLSPGPEILWQGGSLIEKEQPESCHWRCGLSTCLGRKWEDSKVPSPQVSAGCSPRRAGIHPPPLCRKQHQTLSAPEKLFCNRVSSVFLLAPAAYILANAKAQKVQIQQTMSQRLPPEKTSNQWPHSNSSPTDSVAWTILRYSE